MNKILLLPLLFFIISACSHVSSYHTKLTIINKTDQEIDSITISVRDVNIKVTDIDSGEKITRKFGIPNDKIKYEGAFLICIYVKDSLIKSGTFGYFANTASIQDRYELIIYDDFSYKEALNE